MPSNIVSSSGGGGQFIAMDADAPRLDRIVAVEMELRDFTVDRDIFILTPEEFEARKDSDPVECLRSAGIHILPVR